MATDTKSNAKSFNPFAPVERSKVETPWGDFEIAPPNKARLAAIQAVQAEAEQIADGDLEASVALGIRTASMGVERGDELLEALTKAWDAGDVTIDQIRSLAEFVGAEIAGEADQGNG